MCHVGTTDGPIAISVLKHVNLALTFLAVEGIDPIAGFTRRSAYLPASTRIAIAGDPRSGQPAGDPLGRFRRALLQRGLVGTLVGRARMTLRGMLAIADA